MEPVRDRVKKHAAKGVKGPEQDESDEHQDGGAQLSGQRPQGMAEIACLRWSLSLEASGAKQASVMLDNAFAAEIAAASGAPSRGFAVSVSDAALAVKLHVRRMLLIPVASHAVKAAQAAA